MLLCLRSLDLFMKPFYISVNFRLVFDMLPFERIIFEQTSIINRSFFSLSDLFPKFVREVFLFLEDSLIFAKPE